MDAASGCRGAATPTSPIDSEPHTPISPIDSEPHLLGASSTLSPICLMFDEARVWKPTMPSPNYVGPQRLFGPAGDMAAPFAPASKSVGQMTMFSMPPPSSSGEQQSTRSKAAPKPVAAVATAAPARTGHDAAAARAGHEPTHASSPAVKRIKRTRQLRQERKDLEELEVARRAERTSAAAARSRSRSLSCRCAIADDRWACSKLCGFKAWSWDVVLSHEEICTAVGERPSVWEFA